MNKNWMIVIKIAALSVLFWFLANDWITGSVKFGDVGAWVPLLALFIVLVSSLGLAFLILRKYVYKLVIVFSAAVPFFIFFNFEFYYLLSVTFFIWLLIFAAKAIRDETLERNRINVRVILRRGLPSILTAFFIMISFAYFFSPAVQSIAREKTLPPTSNQIVREIFTTIFSGELEQLSPAERQAAESQVINQVVGQLNEMLGPLFVFLPPVIAFGLFLILQGLSFIFLWPAAGLGMLVFGILKKVKFFKIVEVQVKSEVLEM